MDRPRDLTAWLTRPLLAGSVLVVLACGGEASDAGGASSGRPGGSSPAAGPADGVPTPGGAPAGAAGLGRAPDDPFAAVENLILISLDTLRADRLQTYGYERPTSPQLEAFGQRAVVFENARAQAPQTAPSHASLFTSEYPGAHRVINVHGPAPKVHRLPPGVTTLAEVARAGGVETAAFVSGGNLTRKMDMDRGFDVWDERLQGVRQRADALVAWMMKPGRGRFLAVLHTYEVHAPYLPPRELVPEFTDPAYQGPLRARLERFLALPPDQAWERATGGDYWEGMLDFDEADVGFLSDLYDAEIRYLDGEFRRLVDYVEGHDELRRNTAIVVVADHGEEFKDHGKYQHDQVFDELLHVPLMIRLPPDLERAGYRGRVSEPVELVDVAPTVADLLGVDPGPADWVGRSLVPLMRPGDGPPAGWETRPNFSELVVDPGPKYHRTVTFQGWKYIHVWQKNIDHTWEWLFHVAEDPEERVNLMDSEDPTARKALRRLQALLEERTLDNVRRADGMGEGDAVEMDADMERLMRQLGYIK